jgi:chemotaxis protein histidine kinase CheA
MGIEELQKKQNSAATIHTEAQKEVTNVRTFVRNPAAVNVINENEGTDILAGKTEEKNVINLPLPIQTVPKEALKKAPKAIKNVVYREQPKRQLSRKERLLKYTDAEKNRRMQLLSDNDIPVPKDRDELVALRNMHMEVVNLTDEAGNLLITEGPIHHEKMIRQDYQWKDKTSALIKENYDWLMQYYLSQDDTLESNWDLSKAVPKIKFEEHESKIGTEGMDGAYEKQRGLNCYCCTGAALINQFIAKRRNAPVDNRYANQDKLRSYIPNVRKYDPATADLLDENGYEGNLRGIDESAGAERHDVGNLFDIGDCIFDTLKENNIENAMLNKMVMDVPTLNVKKGDNKRSESKYNNMLAVFANKISEVTNSGSAVGLQMVGSGISHYVTVTAIKGRQLTVYDSSGYGGKPKIRDISDYVKRGVVVELTWISDMKKPEEMTEEYKNLAYDEENGYSVKEQNVRQLSASLTHTKGVTVMKDDKELGEAYEGIVMYSYIPESKKHVDTAPLRTVLSDLDLKKPRRMLNKSAAAFREEADEKQAEEKQEKQEKQPVPEKEEEKQEEKKKVEEKEEEKQEEEKTEEKQEEEKKAEEKEEEKPEDHTKQEEKLPAPSPEALQRREERRRQKRIDKVLDRQRKRKAKEEELEYTIQALSDQLKIFEKEKLSEKDASLIKNSFKNDIKSKQKELERLRKENKKADQEDIRNYEKGLKKEKDGTVTKKYERDYAAFGLGVSLNNTKIEETDSTEMARIKAALKDYLEIRKKYYNKYQLSEMSAEKFLERGTGFAGVQQKVDIDRSMKKEERAELGDAYMVLREATRNYERTHLHMFKFGRGKARFGQVRLLKEKIEMDNMRFHLSDYRQSILNSLDSKYENDHLTFRKTVMPTWGHYLHLGNKIDLRNQAYRDKRRRQKEEGKLPAWYKRAWSWTKTGMQNTGLRALMGYEAAGGLIDRTLGLATATVANTLNLTGKVVKTPLKLASCLFNGVSKLTGSKKRWRVNNDPTEGWSGIDDGRKIFRRYLKGLCIIPQAMIEPIYRGVPRLWGHKYKHGVFKLSSRWAKDIWQDVRKVGENLGIKDYDAITARSREDVRIAGGYALRKGKDVFVEGKANRYRGEKMADEEVAAAEDEALRLEQEAKQRAIFASIKVRGLEVSDMPVIKDVLKRKTTNDTEGDRLLDALNADRLETIDALAERFGKDRLEKVKGDLTYTILYSGMNNARELKRISDEPVKTWGTLKDFTRGELFDIDFNAFLYQNEEEFKKNFVKNYKKLQYFDLMYEDYFGKNKDSDFINQAMSGNHYGAEFYERLKLVRSIKEDYDRRIELLQGKEVPKEKKTGFRMGMNSRNLEAYLSKNIERSARADANRQADLAKRVMKEYTAFCRENHKKYAKDMDAENVYPSESVFDFMKMKAEKLPVPEFTDEQLSTEMLDTFYSDFFNVRGSEISEEQRMIVDFKNSDEFKKLPAKLQKAYTRELEKYRERRREYEKKRNLEKIYEEYAMTYADGTDFDIGLDNTEFTKNPYFTTGQKNAIRQLNSTMSKVDWDLIRRNGDPNPDAIFNYETLYQDAQEFTNFRMKHGICLTKDDPSGKKAEEFEKSYVADEKWYITVRIKCNGVITEVRTLNAYDDKKDLNLEIEAKSEEELNKIKEELAEQERLMKKSQSNKAFKAKKLGGSSEINGVMGSEFEALQLALYEKAKAICDYYLKKDDKEAKEDAAKQEAHEEKSEQKEQKKFDLIVKGPFVFKEYPAIKVDKDKKLIKACADKYSNIIKQRETFLSDNEKLQSEEWKKMRHDSEPGGSSKIKALTGIMSYFYGDSDEEAWEFYSSLLADKKSADVALKNKKARSIERLFEHVVSFDLNRFNFKNVNEMFSEKYLDEMLTSYLTNEFPEELFEEYKEFIEDKQIDCALRKQDLDNVRFKWKILHDTTELFRMLPTEAAKQDITQEDIDLALSSSGEECLKMAQKYSQTSQDKADFFNRMASVMEHMKEIGFKPTDNVCRHYHTAMLEDEEIGNFDGLDIATRIQNKRRDLGLAPEDSRMTEEYFAPTLDEELDRTVKHYNGSGISKAGLQDVIETTKAMYEVSKQKDASLPVDLFRSVAKTDVLKDFDNRGLLSLLRPVKLDADGRPATDEDERNLKQNISDVNKLKENTLSARIDVLESMVSRAKSIMFTPKELKDYKFLRNNRARAVRCLQMMFSMLNLFLNNRRYFISQASAETREFMFMLNEGSNYVPYMSFHIQNALFSQGNRIKGMGSSNWHDFRLPYDYGLDYNQMRQENKKIATQMNSSCMAYGNHFINYVQEGKFDPYEIKPEEEKDEEKFQDRLAEIQDLEYFATEGQHLKMSDLGGQGEKVMMKHLFEREKRKDVKEFTHADREKIINRYMGGFKKKEYDPKLMQEIDAALEEYRQKMKPQETEVTEDITPEMKDRLKGIDELYKDSGIPEKDLDLIKDMELRGMIFTKRAENALPEELLKQLAEDEKEELPGVDGRGLTYLLQPVGLNEKGEPATEEEQRKRKQNIEEFESLKSGKLSDRKPMLDRIAHDAVDIVFTSEQLRDTEYILAHKEKALRFLSFMHNGLNLY